MSIPNFDVAKIAEDIPDEMLRLKQAHHTVAVVARVKETVVAEQNKPSTSSDRLLHNVNETMSMLDRTATANLEAAQAHAAKMLERRMYKPEIIEEVVPLLTAEALRQSESAPGEALRQAREAQRIFTQSLCEQRETSHLPLGHRPKTANHIATGQTASQGETHLSH